MTCEGWEIGCNKRLSSNARVLQASVLTFLKLVCNVGRSTDDFEQRHGAYSALPVIPEVRFYGIVTFYLGF